MKKRIKLLFAFFLGILIVSCSLENEVLHEHNHKNAVKIQTINYADLIKNNKFSSAVKRLPKKKVLHQDSIGRSIIENTYGFTILDAPVKVVEIEEKTTYTLQIVSDDKTSDELENLILYDTPQNNKIGHLITYNTSKTTDKTANEILESGIKEDAIITSEGISENNASGKFIIIWFFYSACNGIPYDCGGSICGFNYYQETIWIPDFLLGGDIGSNSGNGLEGGGTESGSGGTGYIGNTTGNESTEDTIITIPTHCPGGCPELITEDDNVPASPCNKVKGQLSKFPEMKQKLIDLAATTSQGNENGIYALEGYSGNEPDAIKTVPQGTAGELEINPNPPTPYVMFAHTHNSPADTTYSIFSWDDLTTLTQLLHNNQIKTNEFVFYVITADGTRYALTINNKEKFMKYIFDLKKMPIGTLVDMDRVKKKSEIENEYYSKEYDNVPLIKENSNPNDDKLNFLKMMKKANMGADLFEVDATFTTFTKLTLNNDNNNIIETPCQ